MTDDRAPGAGDPPAEGPAPEPSPQSGQPVVPPDPGVPPTPTSPAAVAGPLVAWEAPAVAPSYGSTDGTYAGGPPPFTVGALLSDTFARYGADLLRLFVVSAVASGLSWVGSFAAPMGSNPFRPTGFVDVSGLLGILSFVAGIVGSSTMIALAEGGRAVGFGRAIRRGVERAGWVFLTSLLLVVAFVALLLLALIPIGLFLVISPVLVVVPMVVVFLGFVWVSARLVLALPANVADNLNSIEAVKLSWRVTKPTGVWLRTLGASILLGLMVAPAAFGAILLVFPAMFGGGGQLGLLLLPAVAFALFTPLSLLLSFSAYRRLVPPLQPSWTDAPAMPAAPTMDVGGPPSPGPVVDASDSTPASTPASSPAMDAPPVASDTAQTVPLVPWVDPAATATVASAEPLPTAEQPPTAAAAAPPFRVPRLGTAGKALIALVLAFDVAGIIAIPYGIAQMEKFVRDGFPGFPGAPGTPGFPGFPGDEGIVFPGQVAFGTNANLDSCTVESQLIFATTAARIEWIAALERTVTAQDEVFLRITRDGQVLETTLQDPGTYDCLGSVDPEPTLVEGVYTYDVVVNGTVSSTGSLFVQ